jgi:hypothetical protein
VDAFFPFLLLALSSAKYFLTVPGRLCYEDERYKSNGKTGEDQEKVVLEE